MGDTFLIAGLKHQIIAALMVIMDEFKWKVTHESHNWVTVSDK